jgi:hypothetical protein
LHAEAELPVGRRQQGEDDHHRDHLGDPDLAGNRVDGENEEEGREDGGECVGIMAIQHDLSLRGSEKCALILSFKIGQPPRSRGRLDHLVRFTIASKKASS